MGMRTTTSSASYACVARDETRPHTLRPLQPSAVALRLRTARGLCCVCLRVHAACDRRSVAASVARVPACYLRVRASHSSVNARRPPRRTRLMPTLCSRAWSYSTSAAAPKVSRRSLLCGSITCRSTLHIRSGRGARRLLRKRIRPFTRHWQRRSLRCARRTCRRLCRRSCPRRCPRRSPRRRRRNECRPSWPTGARPSRWRSYLASEAKRSRTAGPACETPIDSASGDGRGTSTCA